MLLEYLIILPQNRYSSTRKLVLVIVEQRVGVCAGRSQWVKSNVLNNLAMSATKD